MDEQAPNYRGEFLKSPHHAALGILTLGLGFLMAELLPLIVGATLYTLGWIYLPDMSFFRRWVDKRYDKAKRAQEMQKVADFVSKREELLGTLSPERRARYNQLARVCRDIEVASADNLLASQEAAKPQAAHPAQSHPIWPAFRAFSFPSAPPASDDYSNESNSLLQMKGSPPCVAGSWPSP